MEPVTTSASANDSKTSRVGKRPIDLPKGVTANVSGRSIDVKGPKGQLTRGLVEHSWWNIGVAAFIGLLYWYQVYNILPTDQPVSWQGHLLGLAGGALSAIFFRRRRRSRSQPALFDPTTTTLTDFRP